MNEIRRIEDAIRRILSERISIDNNLNAIIYAESDDIEDIISDIIEEIRE